MFAPRDVPALAAGASFGRARPGAEPRRRAPLTSSHQAPAAASVAPPPPPVRREALVPFRELASRRASVRRRIEHFTGRYALAFDLADDIGSLRWFRGLATFLALSAAALAMWPDFAPLEAAPLTMLDDTARAEFAAQAVRPARLGAVNGRHFAAGEAVVRLDAAPERSTIELAAMLGENDSLSRMLQRAGVGAADAGAVAALVSSVVPSGEIAPGTRFAITLGSRSSPVLPRPLEAIAFRPRFDLALSIARRGGGLTLDRMPIAVDTHPLRIRGAVGSSLYRSARAAGADPETVQEYLRTIDQFLPFEEIGPQDQFDLVVSYKRTADGQGQAGDLLYAGIVGSGGPRVQLLRWGPDGGFISLQALSGTGSADGGSDLAAPVAGRITSGFGLRRHPILGFVRMHSGVDFAAGWGSPIYAVSDGRVNFAGWHGGHGNYVRIDHGGGLGTGYGHMSRIAVAPGMTVRRGQVIGYVGSTGLSTGPHLHYEVYEGGRTVNPLSIRMAARRAPVDPGQLSAFRARLQQMLAIRPGIPGGRAG